MPGQWAIKKRVRLFISLKKSKAFKGSIAESDHVKVVSQKGDTVLKIKLSLDIPQGIVFTDTHFPHGGVNILTSIPENDGETRTCSVRVEKLCV